MTNLTEQILFFGEAQSGTQSRFFAYGDGLLFLVYSAHVPLGISLDDAERAAIQGGVRLLARPAGEAIDLHLRRYTAAGERPARYLVVLQSSGTAEVKEIGEDALLHLTKTDRLLLPVDGPAEDRLFCLLEGAQGLPTSAAQALWSALAGPAEAAPVPVTAGLPGITSPPPAPLPMDPPTSQPNSPQARLRTRLAGVPRRDLLAWGAAGLLGFGFLGLFLFQLLHDDPNPTPNVVRPSSVEAAPPQGEPSKQPADAVPNADPTQQVPAADGEKPPEAGPDDKGAATSKKPAAATGGSAPAGGAKPAAGAAGPTTRKEAKTTSRATPEATPAAPPPQPKEQEKEPTPADPPAATPPPTPPAAPASQPAQSPPGTPEAQRQ
jgi:hypothetical protein